MNSVSLNQGYYFRSHNEVDKHNKQSNVWLNDEFTQHWCKDKYILTIEFTQH